MGNQVEKIDKKVDQLLHKAFDYLIYREEASEHTVDIISVYDMNNDDLLNFEVSDQLRQQSLITPKAKLNKTNIEKSAEPTETQLSQIQLSKRKVQSQMIQPNKNPKKVCINKENFRM